MSYAQNEKTIDTINYWADFYNARTTELRGLYLFNENTVSNRNRNKISSDSTIKYPKMHLVNGKRSKRVKSFNI